MVNQAVQDMRAITTKNFYKKLNAGEPAKPFPFTYLTREMFERALSGEDRRITYHLEYDKAIAVKASAACEALRERARPCNVYGWAGQFAYDGHLNEYKIKRTHDDPFYTPYPDDCDFHIDVKGEETRIEVKTTQPGDRYKECRIYKYRRFEGGKTKTAWHRPDYIVAIKCMNEHMTHFKISGWMMWQDVEQHGDFQEWDEGGRWGIPLDSEVIRDYSLLLNDLRFYRSTDRKPL